MWSCLIFTNKLSFWWTEGRFLMFRYLMIIFSLMSRFSRRILISFFISLHLCLMLISGKHWGCGRRRYGDNDMKRVKYFKGEDVVVQVTESALFSWEVYFFLGVVSVALFMWLSMDKLFTHLSFYILSSIHVCQYFFNLVLEILDHV